jgi:hypothetical protein
MKIGGFYNVHETSEPDDRVSRLAHAAAGAIEAHSEYGDDVKAIILIDTAGEGTIGMLGYEPDEGHPAVLAAMLQHVAVIASAGGLQVDVLGIPSSPEGIDDDP